MSRTVGRADPATTPLDYRRRLMPAKSAALMVAYGHGRVIHATWRRTSSACGGVYVYAIQLGRMHKESAMKLHGGHVVVIGGKRVIFVLMLPEIGPCLVI